jgi:predicted ArsR family transcriptional regulator
MAGPLQNQILATLENLGPSSARQVAEQLGMQPESLYYHLRRLRAAGLLADAGQRATRRRPETLFAVPGRELILDPDNQQPAFLEALARVQRSLLSMATRLYARALRRGVGIRSGSRRNLCVIQQNARLSTRDLAELNRKLEGVATFMAMHDKPDVAPFLSVTISISPLRDES